MFRFEDPWVLTLLALVPVAVWIRWRQERRGVGTLRYSAVDRVLESGAGVSRWRHRLPRACAAAAAAARHGT